MASFGWDFYAGVFRGDSSAEAVVFDRDGACHSRSILIRYVRDGRFRYRFHCFSVLDWSEMEYHQTEVSCVLKPPKRMRWIYDGDCFDGSQEDQHWICLANICRSVYHDWIGIDSNELLFLTAEGASRSDSERCESFISFFPSPGGVKPKSLGA